MAAVRCDLQQDGDKGRGNAEEEGRGPVAGRVDGVCEQRAEHESEADAHWEGDGEAGTTGMVAPTPSIVPLSVPLAVALASASRRSRSASAAAYGSPEVSQAK